MSSFRVSTFLLALVSAIVPNPTQAGGTLVIVGGALEPDNRAVFEAFIGALPRQGPVVIVPAASASPASSAKNFSAQLEGYGLDPDRLVRALAETGECFGYGIGEDTAMVVDLDDRWATVLGSGVVVLVDVSGASLDSDSNLPARGVTITYASAQARFPLRQCEPSGDLGFSARSERPAYTSSEPDNLNSDRSP